MDIEPSKTGTYLKAFNKDTEEGTKSLRIGKQVPLGDVNLAYVHTPRINPLGNMSLINTADIYDNIIPPEQKESLAAANAEGKLEYVELINGNEVQTRAPKTIFPSNHISITNAFKKKKFNNENAMFYKFELAFHYESKERKASERILYDGNQIKITDINGNVISNSYNYEIYITPQPYNTKICLVEIFMHDKANDNETFFVQYNHVDRVAKDVDIINVKKKVELYSRKQNVILDEGVVKSYLENGKSRIINSGSQFALDNISKVLNEQEKVEPKEIYSLEQLGDKDGYEITVPQRSEIDTRNKNGFSFRISVEFFDNDGNKKMYTTGFMTNWVINESALLDREKLEYSGDFKDISGIIGLTKMDVKEMVIRSVPPRYATKMNAATYWIEDDKFNKMYTDTLSSGNNSVECRLSGSEALKIQAKSNGTIQSKWIRAEAGNTILKNNRLDHQCTIIAERQKTYWKFKWEAFAEGVTLSKEQRKVKDVTKDGEIIERDELQVIKNKWKSVEWKKISGEAEVWYNPDGTYTSKFTPSILPVREIEELGVLELKWTDVTFPEGDTDCGIEIVESTIRHKMSNHPKTEIIGIPYTMPIDSILKSEGIKKIGEIFGPLSIYNKLKIPKDIPYKDICLRIERGVSTLKKLEDESTMDFRLNYRFLVVKGGYEAMPVDQHVKWFGMNRIRLLDYLDENGWLEKSLSIDVVAWTMFEEIEISPMYAIKIEEDRRVDIEVPRVADDKLEYDNWYVRIKNGRLFKTITLPGYDISRGISPQIYTVYPELIPYAPSLCENKDVELEYEITEYPNQEFFGERKMLIEDETPIILDDYTIKLANAPIYLEGEDDKGFIEVKLTRGNQNRLLKIADVDAQKGIIYLLDRIQDQDIIKVRYVYEEFYYTYKGFERFEANQGVLIEPINLSLDIAAGINLSVEFEEVQPVIEIKGPDIITKGEKYKYTIEITHPSEEATYEFTENWNGVSKELKRGTMTTKTLLFETEINSDLYNEDLDGSIYLTVEALGDGIVNKVVKQIKIKKKDIPPIVQLDYIKEWCLDLSPTLMITGKILHENHDFKYSLFVNNVEIANGIETNFKSIDISKVLDASNYGEHETAVVKLVAEANGFIEEEIIEIELKKCGNKYIPHDYQIKVVMEYGDIIDSSTNLIYQEGHETRIDMYMIANANLENYVNYQQRVFESISGKMYLDFDRISTSKESNGVVQNEILTIDRMQGESIEIVMHDFSGFFQSQIGKYSLSEGITISVYSIEEEIETLIMSQIINIEDFPINNSPYISGDFSKANKRGYLSVLNIDIPDENKITSNDIMITNTQGIYYS